MIFDKFDYDKNVILRNIDLQNFQEIHIAADLNVIKTVVIFAVKVGDDFLVYDELIMMGGRISHDLKDFINCNFKNKKVYLHLDPNGANTCKKSANGISDEDVLGGGNVIIVKNDAYDSKYKKLISVKDRIDVLNNFLLVSDNKSSLFIHSKCGEIIEALRNHSYTQNGMIDKLEGYDYATDSLCFLAIGLNFSCNLKLGALI